MAQPANGASLARPIARRIPLPHHGKKRQRQQVMERFCCSGAAGGQPPQEAGASEAPRSEIAATTKGGVALNPFGLNRNESLIRRVAEVVDQIGEECDAAGGESAPERRQSSQKTPREMTAQTVSKGADAGVIRPCDARAAYCSACDTGAG